MSIPGVEVFDFSIDVDKIQQGALAILRKVRPQWEEKDVVFKSYTDGITNILLGCRHRDDSRYQDSILVRVFGAKTEVIIDRELEKIAMYVLNKAGCGKPLYAQFQNGLSYGFVAGSCLTAKTVRDVEIGRLVAEEMVRLGAVDPTEHRTGLPEAPLQKLANREPCLFTKIRKFLGEYPESFPEPERTERLKTHIKSLPELEAEFTVLQKEVSHLGSPVVLCHNDILLNNVVHNAEDGRCYFIDYEYIGFNYQAFDIGNHFAEWAGVDVVDYDLYPDKPTQLVWLRHYLRAYKAQQGHSSTEPTERELEILYVQANKFALASHFFWGCWALVQARHSTIDFDFLDYSKIRFDEYFRRRSEFLSLEMPE